MIKDWHGWVGTFTGVAAITVLALPLAALAVWALAHHRSVTGAPKPWRRSLVEVGIVYGTVPPVWLTMLPGSRAGSVPGRVSLVPLRDLLAILANNPLTAADQIVGNLLVFAALGFLAPLRFAALASIPRILALTAGCSVLVETAQYVLRLDRVSSVDDVLVNTIGAVLATLASRHWWRAVPSRDDSHGEPLVRKGNVATDREQGAVPAGLDGGRPVRPPAGPDDRRTAPGDRPAG